MGRTSSVACFLLLAFLASGCAERLLDAAVKRERRAAGLEPRTVQAAGHTVAYLDGGEGEPFLLLHGFGGSRDNWTRFAAHFTADHRVVAPDLPGFGESTHLADAPYDIAAQVGRVHAFVEAVGLSRFHLAGNSMGGNLAAAYAATHPDRVLSLALYAPAGVASPEPSEVTLARARGENPLLVESPEDFGRLMGLLFVEPPKAPRSIIRYFAEAAVEARPRHARIHADLMARPFPLEPVLGELGLPVLVVWGDRDRILDPSGMHVFEAALPAGRFVVMKDCGHLPMLERPAEAAEHQRAFFAALR